MLLPRCGIPADPIGTPPKAHVEPFEGATLSISISALALLISPIVPMLSVPNLRGACVFLAEPVD